MTGRTRRAALPVLSGIIVVLAACARGYGTTRVSATAQLGPGIDLYAYSADRDGDWHTNYRQWTPVTVYESNGVYYPKNVSGARPVQVYHSPSGYILPPRDKDVASTDKRLNTKKMPTDEDYSRARPRP